VTEVCGSTTTPQLTKTTAFTACFIGFLFQLFQGDPQKKTLVLIGAGFFAFHQIAQMFNTKQNKHPLTASFP